MPPAGRAPRAGLPYCASFPAVRAGRQLPAAKLAEDKAKAENEVLRREAAALREQLEKMRSKEARREERAQQAAQQTAGRSEDAEQKG